MTELMSKYGLFAEAERDLESIWQYTLQKWGVEQAMQYIDELAACFQNLVEYSATLRLRTEFSPPVYIYKCNHHLIVYLCNGEYASVVRVLHEKMDIDNQLQQ